MGESSDSPLRSLIMNLEYRPRFTFEISEEQQFRANNLLGAYGLRKAIFSNILDDVLDIIEQSGNMAIGIMCSSKIKPRDIIPTINQVDKLEKVKDK